MLYIYIYIIYLSIYLFIYLFFVSCILPWILPQIKPFPACKIMWHLSWKHCRNRKNVANRIKNSVAVALNTLRHESAERRRASRQEAEPEQGTHRSPRAGLAKLHLRPVPSAIASKGPAMSITVFIAFGRILPEVLEGQTTTRTPPFRSDRTLQRGGRVRVANRDPCQGIIQRAARDLPTCTT